MRAASIPKSSWRTHKGLHALSLAATLLLSAGAACASDGALKLKLATSLSSVADRRDEPATLAVARVPALTLAMSKSLGAPAFTGPVAELLLQVDVNRQNLADTVIVLRSADGGLLVGGEDLERWRLRKPDVPPYEHAGSAYYPLNALPGATYKLDEAKQTLQITASPKAFDATRTALRGAQSAKPVLPQPGGFFNYTVSGANDNTGTNWAGLFEAGYFSRYGVFTNSMLAPDLSQSSSWLRLDSTYTIDYPDKLTSLHLGDYVTQSGAWGRAVRFGGVQYGTNFGTQPGFIRYPVSAAIGQAALPSTVDVFVNNALVSRQSVPPGPFSINNIPTVTGSGEIRMVVRDLLGREQVITQPFYGTTLLLKEGLSAYSYELGSVREDYGVSSDAYGPGIGALTYQHGFTDQFTGEARAEYSGSTGAAGLSGAYLLGDLATLNANAAFSSGDAGSGHLLGVGVERVTNRFSLGLAGDMASSEFRQSGMAPDELPRRKQYIGNVGYQMGTAGSVSLTYVAQYFRDQPDLKVSTLSYSLPLGKFAQLGINALKTYGATGGTTFTTSLAIPLGNATSASISSERNYDKQSGNTDNVLSTSIQKSLPIGEGYGYSLQTRNSDVLGSFSAQTDYGTYVLEAAKTEGNDTATRVTASGGIGLVGGHAFFSRTLDGSFAVVRVADYPNVGVFKDNQAAGHTDADGYAVLPRLRPYERNPIGIEQNDLPFDAKIGALKLEAVPYYRSGVLVDFPVQRVRAGTFRVVLEDGSDLPSGALARFEGRGAEFPIALRGEAYLEGFEATNRIRVTWKGQSCVLDVPYPRTKEPLPDLGTFVCKWVKP
jgi:outer membrane usher protein